MSRRCSRGARLNALLALFAVACGGSQFTSGQLGDGGADAGGVTSSGGGASSGGSGGASAGGNGSGTGGVNAGGVMGVGGSNGGSDLDASDGSTAGHGGDAGLPDADASSVGGSDSGTDSSSGGASGGSRGSGGGSSSGGASGSGGAASGGASSSGGASASGGALGSGGAGTGGVSTSPTTWYPDNDHDGFGVTADAVEACSAPTTGTWVTVGGDCLDDNALVHPQDGAAETAYYYTPYSVPGGGESFDYDCSGTETGDPSQAAYSSCSALSLGACPGSGYSKTTRTTGDPYCGSAAYVTCSGTLVCSGTTKSLPADQAYRCH